MGRLPRFLGGASARRSGADLGWAASTSCDVMLGAGAGAAVRVLVTITGEPGISMKSKAITAKATAAKKPRAGTAVWSLTGNVRFRSGQSVSGDSRSCSVLRLRKPYDAESIGVAKNLNEWLTPSGEIGSRLPGAFTANGHDGNCELI
jgi:hypothetical protein